MTGQEGLHENYKKKSDLKQMAGSLFSQEEKKKKKSHEYLQKPKKEISAGKKTLGLFTNN